MVGGLLIWIVLVFDVLVGCAVVCMSLFVFYGDCFAGLDDLLVGFTCG